MSLTKSINSSFLLYCIRILFNSLDLFHVVFIRECCQFAGWPWSPWKITYTTPKQTCKRTEIIIWNRPKKMGGGSHMKRTGRSLIGNFTVRAVSLFLENPWGKNAKQVSVRAWLWAWCEAAKPRGLVASPFPRHTHSHVRTITCFAFFSHGFSRKWETPRSLRKFWKEPLRGTKILFCGRDLKCFHP